MACHANMALEISSRESALRAGVLQAEVLELLMHRSDPAPARRIQPAMNCLLDYETTTEPIKPLIDMHRSEQLPSGHK